MCGQVVNVIADQSDRLQRELAGLWAAADLAALTRRLAIAHPHARDQAQLLERIDELDQRIGDALVQVEDTAAALSETVEEIRSSGLAPDRGGCGSPEAGTLQQRTGGKARVVGQADRLRVAPVPRGPAAAVVGLHEDP